MSAAVSDYLVLTKPRVVFMILVVTTAGFVMGWSGAVSSIDWLLLARTLIGSALASGGTLALNMYIERDFDKKMKRTRLRPLPDGRMRPNQALVFGTVLITAGLLILTLTVGPLPGMITALTVVTYLFVYTPMKTRSALCTVLGAFPGALPPVTGWVAASGTLGAGDLGALLLFGILFFWQLPHSLAIAYLYQEDYQRAGIRLLTTVDPEGGSTARQTVWNSLVLLPIGLLPTLVGLTGWIAAVVALLAGGWMLAASWHLAFNRTTVHARRLLIVSYVYIPVVLITMAADSIRH